MKKTRLFATIVLGGMLSTTVLGQEIDDLYFNSKDRAKVNEKKISADLGITKRNSEAAERIVPINPTDSYSARNINPEYSSQLGNDSKALLEDNYFISDYIPKGVNQNLSNCNCNAGSFYNPYYGNNAFNNPYYGYTSGFGSPWSNYYPSYWGNPYYGSNPGWSMSLGYGWGGYNPMWYGGLGYGYNNFWNSYYNPWYNNYWGGYYPGQVIVVTDRNTYGRPSTQSKRASRSSNLNNTVDYTRGSSTAVAGTTRSSISGGRSRTSDPEYYDRSWKRNQETSTTRGYWSNNNNSGNNSSNTRSDFNWGNSGGRQGSSGFSTTPSRSSFNSSGGSMSGGSRSSGSSGSSGGSRTRGRNN